MLLAGCSIQRYAINSLGDMLASGDSIYASDDDPELIAEALPFGLKLIEGLLAEQPEHPELLLAAARGYVLYAYAFVAIPAERLQQQDVAAARAMRQRARDLLLRAHGYAQRRLALDSPGLGAALRADPTAAVASVGRAPRGDVAPLYWTAAALGLAISASRNEPALLARLPEVEALLARALAVEESWNAGALHEFALALTAARPGGSDPAALAAHFGRALELSGGRRAALFVAYAEADAVRRQDRAAFVELLERALAVDVDAYPEERLLNVIARERAQWLLGKADELFLE